MSEQWVPAQSSERFTFLGSLILGTSDLDVHCKIKGDSALTVAVKNEVILLVNERLSNPETQYSDLTLMAVVLMLCGEVVSGDEKICSVHEYGITKIINKRGGMKNLGVGGALAVGVHVYVDLRPPVSLCNANIPSKIDLSEPLPAGNHSTKAIFQPGATEG